MNDINPLSNIMEEINSTNKIFEQISKTSQIFENIGYVKKVMQEISKPIIEMQNSFQELTKSPFEELVIQPTLNFKSAIYEFKDSITALKIDNLDIFQNFLNSPSLNTVIEKSNSFEDFYSALSNTYSSMYSLLSDKIDEVENISDIRETDENTLDENLKTLIANDNLLICNKDELKAIIEDVCNNNVKSKKIENYMDTVYKLMTIIALIYQTFFGSANSEDNKEININITNNYNIEYNLDD